MDRPNSGTDTNKSAKNIRATYVSHTKVTYTLCVIECLWNHNDIL